MVYRTKLPETASVANSKGDARLFAPSADRNSTPIVNLIKQIAPKSGEAFEIASGTGQHIVKLALSLPNLSWSPSEVDEERIKRRINRKDDRMEKEGRDFLSNVSRGFQALSEDSKWKKISAINSKENILHEIQSEIKKLIKNK